MIACMDWAVIVRVSSDEDTIAPSVHRKQCRDYVHIKDMFRQISCGFNHTLALTFNGHVYGWGFNASGQVGAGRARVVATPTRIRFPGKYIIEKVIGYESTSFAITSNGRVFIWGAIRLFTPSYTPTLINLDNVTFIKDICFNLFIVYMLSIDGNIYVYFDGAFQKSEVNPLQLLNDLVFDEIRQINSYEGKDSSEARPIIAGITDDTVYHLFRSNKYEIIETKCKTFDEFYANELQMTVTTIAVNGCQRNIPADTANGYYKNTFDVLDKLGHGGYGTVYKVRDKHTSELYAIKISEFKVL
ncbi:unnamed protein product [Oppiella nova]|uniref:Protein kinase domain-containing protein n=1 Tax=Oppiella nova TaxID=334625 RepID=A0A7R9QR40_9ACAR|nr:unnamed protein product [Oppiella nova]CAG2171235.1 unnamed protein product [Oppiella nova]